MPSAKKRPRNCSLKKVRLRKMCSSPAQAAPTKVRQKRTVLSTARARPVNERNLVAALKSSLML